MSIPKHDEIRINRVCLWMSRLDVGCWMLDVGCWMKERENDYDLGMGLGMRRKIMKLFKNEIDKSDKEIDQMVYELYGLSVDEIGIVEGEG